MATTLYICYFGLREPLVQTQVLPYLREIVKMGVKVRLLTFETEPSKTWSSDELSRWKSMLVTDGIEWEFLTYHKRPSVPATFYDIVCGAFHAWRLNRKEHLDVIHARVHVPALMGALAKATSWGRRPKLLFDIRGFFPEEYTDAGIWQENGLLFKAVKRVESWLLKMSDGFVVLTEKAREILFPESAETGFDRAGRPVEVIPCCVDTARFGSVGPDARSEVRSAIGAGDRFVATYVGSFGGWYLTEETMRFFGALKRLKPDAFALILTQGDAEHVRARLRQEGYSESDMKVGRVDPSEMPRFLQAADIAVSFIKPCYSKLASSPTKIAEYLASGLPVVVNEGIGDSAEFVRADRVGVVIAEFSDSSYEKALVELEGVMKQDGVSGRCLDSARRRYSLTEIGGERYRRIYRRLSGEDDVQ